MGVAQILQSIDREIALLQQARALLSDTAVPAPRKAPGRPKKAAAVKITETKTKKKKKRNLTPEGRKRIAEAVKRRWEAQKKSSSGTK